MRTGVITSSISRSAGGICDAIRFPVSHLKERVTSCDIFTLHDEYTDIDIKLWPGIDIHVMKSIGSKSFGYSPKLLPKLYEYDLDIMHVHGMWMFPSYANHIYCKRTATPYIISPHGMLEPWALRNSYIKKLLARFLFENRNLKNAQCLHALTEREAKDIRAYGLKQPISIIPNGIDIPVFEKQKKVKLDDARKKILFIGRIHPKKGLVSLIKAWAQVQKNCTDFKCWSLEIAGWSQLDHENELKKLVADLNVADSVRFLGPIYDSTKQKELLSADAFILPSLSEGLPMSILEAWSYKLPVLMTPECNITHAYELNAAIKIEANCKSISNGLYNLINMSSTDLNKIGENGFDLVKNQYSWSRISDDFLKVYSWIVGGGQRPDNVILI